MKFITGVPVYTQFTTEAAAPAATAATERNKPQAPSPPPTGSAALKGNCFNTKMNTPRLAPVGLELEPDVCRLGFAAGKLHGVLELQQQLGPFHDFPYHTNVGELQTIKNNAFVNKTRGQLRFISGSCRKSFQLNSS